MNQRMETPSPLTGEGRGQGVEIPADVVVRCPLTRFELRPAGKCDGCQYFGGLTDMLGNDARPFHRRFAVNCKFGIDRELQKLAAE